MDYSKIIEKLGKNRVKLDEPMSKHTTFKIGGPADLFYETMTEGELIRVISLSRKIGVPYFILGGGSNILVSDRGFRGMVIKICNTQYLPADATHQALQAGAIRNTRIIAGAGAPLAKLVQVALKNSLSGFEFAVGVPGTVGGAVRGNAGAWQQSIGERILRVKVLTNDGEVKWIKGTDCQFGYRYSRFKKSGEIILEAEFNFRKGNKKEIREKISECLQKRRKDPKEPSVGCIFINPRSQSAGELIDLCGLKGKQIGQAQISPLHANFIVNLGGASCQDVLKLIALVKREVENKFGIELKEEIEIVGGVLDD